jgi:hypothetical protein
MHVAPAVSTWTLWLKWMGWVSSLKRSPGKIHQPKASATSAPNRKGKAPHAHLGRQLVLSAQCLFSSIPFASQLIKR